MTTIVMAVLVTSCVFLVGVTTGLFLSYMLWRK